MWILALFFKDIAVLELRCASVSCTLLGDVQRTRFYYLSWVSRCSIHILPAGVELQTLQLMQSSNVLYPESFKVLCFHCVHVLQQALSVLSPFIASCHSLHQRQLTYLLMINIRQSCMILWSARRRDLYLNI